MDEIITIQHQNKKLKIKHSAFYISRREFNKLFVFVITIFLFPIFACKKLTKKHEEKRGFNEYERSVLSAVQEHLFPSTFDSPGAKDINATKYLENIMKNKIFKPSNRQLIKSGIYWVDETASKLENRSFLKLSIYKKEKVLRDIETFRNGEKWLSLILTYIFEALLSDPLYGGNPNGIGWQWLEHQPGYPRPNSNMIYS